MKNKVIVLFSVIMLVSLGFADVCNATVIFTDDFNSYSDGDLSGQGGWRGSSDLMKVQSGVVFEGSKAVMGDTAFVPTFVRTGALQSDGKIMAYVRRDDLGKGGFRLLGDISWGADVRFFSSSNDTNGVFIYKDANNNNQVFAVSNSNKWYSLEIEWRSVPSHQVRYSIDGINWTSWVNPYIDWISGLNGVGLLSENSLDGHIYFDAIGENPIVNAKTPVLIVPGLMGTEMGQGDEVLWANLNKMFLNPSDSFMDSLGFNKNITPSSSAVAISDVIHAATFSGFKVLNYTDGLITEFTNQGYTKNETLFTFPYDWRYGASGEYTDGKTNSDLLGQKIQDILTQTGSDKIDVIAHSEGGLVVKKYVVDHPANHHIGKAIFVGVPNTGAPKAVKVLLQGDNFGIPWLSENEMKKVSENLPVGYDLLPSQQYYDTKGSFVKVIDEGDLLNLFDTTQKDLNYSEFGNFLTNDHSLNSEALTNAKNLHAAVFDNFDMRTTGIDLYAIDGCKAGTLGKIIEVRSKNILGQPQTTYKNPKMVPGDGTVPLESATNLPIDAVKKYYSLTGEHSKLMSQDGSRQEIVNLLAGSTLEVKDKLITQDITKCKLNGKAISVFSPINIFVTDQYDNKLGLADDGSIFNEIPNADFEVWGEHKFLYLPTDDGQVYDIKIKGTGAGTYTMNSQNIVDNEVTGSEVFSNLPVTMDLTGSVNLGTQTTLTVQENPSSAPQTILPSATLDATTSQDFLPPVSTLTLTGSAGQTGFYRSDVNVSLSATDDVSGVLALNYNVDGVGYKKVLASSSVFTVTKEGSHTITFFATDNAGNNEQEQILNFAIDKTAPEVVIEFNSMIKDLKFSAQNDVAVTIVDKDDVVTLTDQAGNVTEMKLKDKDRKKSMSAEVKWLKYNGVAVDIGKNIMQYKWSYNKNKNLKELFQYVKSRKDYNILAVFDGKNTKVIGKDFTGKVSKSFSGLKIIKISTNKGDFNWSY